MAPGVLKGTESKEEREGEEERGSCEDEGKRYDCRSEREDSEGGPIDREEESESDGGVGSQKRG